MINSHKNVFAIFGLLFGALAWGVIWYPYRLMAEVGVSGVASSFYTYAIALIIGSVGFAKHWRELLSLRKSAVILSLLAGWTNLGYVIAVMHGEVMRVMLLFYLSPLWTLILAHYWLKEPISRTGVLAVLLSLVGAFVMLWQPHQWPLPSSQSDWLALSAGLGFALSNVMMRKSQHLSLRTKSFAVWLGVVVVALLCQPLIEENETFFPGPSFFTQQQWWLMLAVALVLIAVTITVQYGVTHLLASRASVIFLFELVVAAVASYYLAHEVMRLNEWIGGLFIIASGLIAAFNHSH